MAEPQQRSDTEKSFKERSAEGKNLTGSPFWALANTCLNISQSTVTPGLREGRREVLSQGRSALNKIKEERVTQRFSTLEI